MTFSGAMLSASPAARNQIIAAIPYRGLLEPNSAPSVCGRHELPVADLALIRVIGSVVGVAVIAVAVRPVVLLGKRVLRSSGEGIVHRFHATDVIVLPIVGGARRAAAGGAAGSARGREAAVNVRQEGVVVRRNLFAPLSRSGNPSILRLKIRVKIREELLLDRLGSLGKFRRHAE